LDIFQFGHVLGLPPSNHWAEALETQLQPSAGSLTHLLQAGMGPVAGALFFLLLSLFATTSSNSSKDRSQNDSEPLNSSRISSQLCSPWHFNGFSSYVFHLHDLVMTDRYYLQTAMWVWFNTYT
jgi:hypothetical protein